MSRNKGSGGCDGFVCMLGCLSLVPGIRNRLLSRAAFFPPAPPGYHVCDNGQADREPSVLLDLARMSSGARWKSQLHEMPKIDKTDFGTIRIKALEIPTRDRTSIQAFHFQRHDATHTVVFSHGNSTDIGLIFPHLLDISRRLKVNMLAYDFSGYGSSPGQPSEDGIYANISAVFEHLTGPIHKLSPNQLILYGQSVGSAPTIDLASKTNGIGGVVIHAGMMSGLTVLKSSKTHAMDNICHTMRQQLPPQNYDRIHWFDAFKNLEKIKKVQCPILVIHGQQDLEVDMSHGQSLFEAAPNAQAWWVENAGHNDIEVVRRAEFFSRLADFFRFLGAHTASSEEMAAYRAELGGSVAGGDGTKRSGSAPYPNIYPAIETEPINENKGFIGSFSSASTDIAVSDDESYSIAQQQAAERDAALCQRRSQRNYEEQQWRGLVRKHAKIKEQVHLENRMNTAPITTSLYKEKRR